MNDLKEIKQTALSYGLQSPFGRMMVKTWDSHNMATQCKWLHLVSAVLEDGSQLVWKCYWRKEAKTFRTEKAKEFEASQDQILGKNTYADPHDQTLYDEHILSICHTADFNAWDKSAKLGK